MTRLTPADRSRLKKLAEEATKGPWTIGIHEESLVVFGPSEVLERQDAFPAATFTGIVAYACGGRVKDGDTTKQNQDFIAASRSAVPALLAELEAAEAERDRLREALTKISTYARITRWEGNTAHTEFSEEAQVAQSAIAQIGGSQ